MSSKVELNETIQEQTQLVGRMGRAMKELMKENEALKGIINKAKESVDKKLVSVRVSGTYISYSEACVIYYEWLKDGLKDIRAKEKELLDKLKQQDNTGAPTKVTTND